LNEQLRRLKDKVEDHEEEGEGCPLSAMQAGIIISSLTTIADDQAEMKQCISVIKSDINEIKINAARDEGHKEGATFWFKAGGLSVITALVGGGTLVLLFLTGKVDFSTFLTLLK
jgi:hypothetical protein